MTFSPAPLDVDQVLNAEWLSWALSQGREPVAVSGFEVVETLGPSALKIRIALQFEGAAPTDVPSAICLKGIFDPALSSWLAGGAQKAEALFYKLAAPQLGVRVPRACYSEYDHTTNNGVTIMEDLVPRGARFLSALSAYSIDQAKASLDQLARLHGGTWRLKTPSQQWVTSKLESLASGTAMPPERITELMRGERGEVLPDGVRDGHRIYAAISALDRRGKGLDECFVHGDCHAGNVWEGPDGAGLVDWQVVQRGHWSIDVAYHIAAVLGVEERRRSERELVEHYCSRLAAHGGEPPEADVAWDNYRQAIPYGLMMWAMTVRVQPDIIHEFVKRLGTATADHDSFGLLGV